jgi:DNA repair protein RadA/Sms
VCEAQQLGFTRCVVPEGNLSSADVPKGMTIVGVRNVADALDAVM